MPWLQYRFTASSALPRLRSHWPPPATVGVAQAVANSREVSSENQDEQLATIRMSGGGRSPGGRSPTRRRFRLPPRPSGPAPELPPTGPPLSPAPSTGPPRRPTWASHGAIAAHRFAVEAHRPPTWASPPSTWRLRSRAGARPSSYPARSGGWLSLPKRASWLNQIEIYFSILQRKALTPAHSTSHDEVVQRILSFQDHYQQTASPFEWTFTRSDLNRLMARIPPSLPHGA